MTDDLHQAVMRALEAAGAADRPVDMTLIGPALVAAGYEVDRIAYAIDALLRDRLVERSGSNALRVSKT